MKSYFIPLSLLLLAACNSSNDSNTPTPAPAPPAPNPITLISDFNIDEQSWSAGFSDYPPGEDEFYELTAGIEQLPDSSGNQGFRLKGSNRSDDLFMFLKQEITGLEANTQYELTGSIQFLSNAGEGCIGIGGAPGESVYVKLGASEAEPVQVDYYLSVDKGNQSQPGNDAAVIGDVAAPGISCDGTSFGEKIAELQASEAFEFQSSAEGTIWLFFGTDSGYEGVTDLYYQSVALTLTEQD